MVRKLAPAHRTLDGQPIKTTDIARERAHPRMGAPTPTRARARAPTHGRTHAYTRVPARPCARTRGYVPVSRLRM